MRIRTHNMEFVIDAHIAEERDDDGELLNDELKIDKVDHRRQSDGELIDFDKPSFWQWVEEGDGELEDHIREECIKESRCH